VSARPPVLARRRGAPAVVAVLHGAIPPDAPPDERDTLVQAAEVGAALHRLGYVVATRPVGLDLSRLQELRALGPALVFNLVEALGGEGRLIHLPACVLDTLGLPYTGAPSGALHTTTCKPLAKALMAGAGIPSPPAWTPASRGGPFIVKSAHEDASIGLDDGSVVPARAVPALIEARRRRYGGEWFAEAYVEGREFNQPLLEAEDGTPELLPLGEMEFVGWAPDRPRIVGYAAKWDPASPDYNGTPRTFEPRPGDGPLRARLAELALAAWRLFGLRGYARVDFRVDREGRPWVLEVNANPCLSSDTGFAAAADEAGLDQTELVRRIVEAALREAAAPAPRRAAAS
jgi:D-alanine-D-alanine ligase